MARLRLEKGNGLKNSKVREERELHTSDPCPNKAEQHNSQDHHQELGGRSAERHALG
jgi:hypothetical protein